MNENRYYVALEDMETKSKDVVFGSDLVDEAIAEYFHYKDVECRSTMRGKRPVLIGMDPGSDYGLPDGYQL